MSDEGGGDWGWLSDLFGGGGGEPATDTGSTSFGYFGSGGGSDYLANSLANYALPPIAQQWVDAAQPQAAPAPDFSGSNDYNSIAPNDFSNLDYLVPQGSPAGTFTPEQATISGGDMVPGYGVTDLSGLLPSTGGTPPSEMFDPGIPGGAAPTAGASSTFATLASPAAGAAPSYSVPGQPDKSFSASDFTFNGPAGASSVPNTAALNATPLLTTQTAPAAVSSIGGAGPSAAGNQLPGVGGGPGANDLSQNRPKKEGDTDFLSNFGIKNPLGTALAAGGLAYAIGKGQQQTAPVAALNTVASPLIGTGKALTDTGANTAVAGADNLNALSRESQTTGKTLTDQGTATVNNSVNDLKALAAPVAAGGQQLQTTGAGLTKYVGTGTLPPEMQTQVDQAKSDAKTARISFYASKGMPTDPAKNTSLRSDLERIDRDAISMAATMASDLAKTGTTIYGAGVSGTGQAGAFTGTAGQLGTAQTGAGLNSSQLAGNEAGKAADVGSNLVNSGVTASGLASKTYNELATIDAAQTTNTQKAIAAMAAALSGGTPAKLPAATV